MTSLPNLLTLSRIFALPLLIALMWHPSVWQSAVAFALFCLLGLTDYLDGYLARAQGAVSKLGVFLDPIADKIMVAAVIVMLIAFRRIEGVHVLAALVILLREIAVSGLREFLAGSQISMPVSTLAKWKTTFQMISLGALILAGAVENHWLGVYLPAHFVGLVCLWGAAILTAITGYEYLRIGLKHMD
jgi:cardiolipin synthase (CMP-forming)